MNISPAFFYVMGGALILIVIGLAVYLIRLYTKEQDEPENEIILINLMFQYTKEHALGVINSIEFGTNMAKVMFFPRDINYIKLKKQENKNVSFKEIPLFIPTNAIYNFSSGHRHFLFAFPPKVNLIPDQLRNSPLGKLLISVAYNSEKELEKEEILQNRIKNQAEMLNKTVGYDILEDFIETTGKIKDYAVNPISRETNDKEKKGEE